MKAVLLLSAAALLFTVAEGSAKGQCYQKVGKQCRAGFATGYSADCSSPCKTTPAPAQATGEPAPKQRKPFQVISPTD